MIVMRKTSDTYLLLCFIFFFHFSVLRGFLFPSNRTCYCNNEDMSGSGHRTCIDNKCSSQNSLIDCYVQKVKDKTIEKGCTFSTVCIAYKALGTKLNKEIIHCCRSNMCNENMTGDNLDFDDGSERNKETKVIGLRKEIIIIIVVVPLAVLIGTVYAIWKHYNKLHLKRRFDTALSSLRGDYSKDKLCSPLSSGTGAGCRIMVPETISSQIFLKQCIKKGRFGTLYFHGNWYGTNVCVKIYFQEQQRLWYHECLVYQTFVLHHENILGFVAADSKDSGALTERWLITDYHPKGSLFDYLQNDSFSYERMVKLLFGLVSGLNYLHSTIVSSSRRKPNIAHGALATKKIMMKNDCTCCIADFSSAVAKNCLPLDYVGLCSLTRTRYHSPERLNRTMNFHQIDSYLKSDIYALGICIWEVCWRTTISGITEEYQLPLFEHLSPNASGDDILNVVALENKRPIFSVHWHEVKGMKELMKLMQECWSADAGARLPALRVKKRILSLLEGIEII